MNYTPIRRLFSGWLPAILLAATILTAFSPALNTQAAGELQSRFDVPNLPTGAARHQIGLATHPWWLDMHTDTFIHHFKQLGAGVIRLPVEWKVIEPRPGQYDWTVNDRLLNRLNDEGFEIVAEFVTIPPWASRNYDECAGSDLACGFEPAQSGRFVAAVEATARRYPFIRYWEFWNEPEMWPNAGRDINVYAYWLNLFYQAVKRTDPTKMVAATTLAGPEYINYLYDIIDLDLKLKSRPWDAIGFHPYNLNGELDNGQITPISKLKIEALRRIMVERGDAHKPLWITELGFQADPVDQADMLNRAFNWLTARDYITIIALHMLHDWPGEVYGLMTTEPETFPNVGDIGPETKFAPKQPYYDAFRNYPKHRPGLPPASTPAMLVFPQSGHTVRDIFKRVWEQRGGLELFGYPKTAQFYERNPADGRYYLVQYFERARMEYHPELAGTPYEVQFGLLGNETMVEQGLLDEQGRPVAAATRPEEPRVGPDTIFFRETGHNLSGQFLAAWHKNGGLSIIGFPRSAAYDTRGADGRPLKVQYFERARMELHTGPDGRRFVLFGLLANQRLVEQGRLDINYQPVTSNLFNPANFEFILS